MTTRVLDFADGFQSAAAPTEGVINVNGVKVFASDGAFVADKGSAAAEGDMYFNSTTNFVRVHDGVGFNELVDASSDQTVAGNKTFTGTTTFINSANLNVTDQNITINSGGNDASAEGAGLTVDRTGTDGSLVYENALASKWKAGSLGSEIELVNVSGSQVLSSKDYDGGTASNTSRITLPKASTATLAGLTRKQATLVYDTSLGAPYYDDGASLISLAPSSQVNSALIENCGLSAAVGSSALTISLKQSDGSSDASSGNPIRIGFRSSTITSGAFNMRSVTGALSTVISSGSTAGHTSGTNNYLYIYALDNSGTVELAWSSSLFDTSLLASTTAEGGAGAADSATTIYSTTARSNVPIRLIGRMLSNQTTAGTWAATPTEIALASHVNISSINKVQTKTLSADVTSVGNVAGLSFNSLTVNKLYRVSGVIYIVGNAATDDINGVITSAGITQARWGAINTQNAAWVLHVNFIFVAGASALTFTVSSVAGAGTLLGNGTREESFLQLEELNNYAETTLFT